MPELLPEERLQPSLLDRLTDDEPTRSEDPRDKRVLTLSDLQNSVLRDLEWLLNTAALNTVEELDDYPHVRTSVLNYGMEALAGYAASDLDPVKLAARVRDLILEFEPRLLKQTLEVEAIEGGGQRNQIGLLIRGQLWAQPVPIELYLKSEFDLESGSAAVFQHVD